MFLGWFPTWYGRHGQAYVATVSADVRFHILLVRQPSCGPVSAGSPLNQKSDTPYPIFVVYCWLYWYIYICMYVYDVLFGSHSLPFECHLQLSGAAGPQFAAFQTHNLPTKYPKPIYLCTSAKLPFVYRSSTYLLYTPTYYLRCVITTCILSTLQTTYHQPRWYPPQHTNYVHTNSIC